MAKTLKQIQDEFYSEREILVEVTDTAEIKKMMESKASCCWVAGQVIDDGWVLLCQPSVSTAGNKQLVYVCRLENVPF